MVRCTVNIVKKRQNNAFTSGCTQFKKDILKKHVATVDHRIRLTVKSGKRDMQQAVSKVHRNQEHTVCAALQTVYFTGGKSSQQHFCRPKTVPDLTGK